jgi:hypothetical protein
MKAADELEKFNTARTAKGKPPVKLRIVCLSDGDDTCSTNTAFRTAASLQVSSLCSFCPCVCHKYVLLAANGSLGTFSSMPL